MMIRYAGAQYSGLFIECSRLLKQQEHRNFKNVYGVSVNKRKYCYSGNNVLNYRGGRVVAGRFVSVCIVAVVCLGGCFESKTTVNNGSGGTGRIDSSGGMIEYLQRQNLPSLESVEQWQNEYGPGLKLVTAHYEIFTTFLDPLMLCLIPRFMESAHQAYNGQLPEPIETTSKFSVYLFANRRQWTDFTKEFGGEEAELFLKIKAGAYYHNGSCVAYNIGRKRTLSALAHEGWHQFNSRHFKYRLPSWLDEGVAMLFEAYKIEDGEFSFGPAENEYRIGALRKTLRRRNMIPLRELMGINPGEVFATNASGAVMAFYSQSYALAWFLQSGGPGGRNDSYQQLLLDGLEGNWPIDKVSKKIAEDRNIPKNVLWNRVVGMQLFKHYVGSDIDSIEKEYLAFCRQIVENSQ